MQFILNLLNGERIEYKVTSPTCLVGRSAKCDLVVPHDGMSRQHCLIETSGGEFFVTDLGSTNGVLIDGVKIPPHQKTPFALYLTLSFGAVQSLQIVLDDPRARQVENKANLELKSTHMEEQQDLTKTKNLKQVQIPEKQYVSKAHPLPRKSDTSKAKFWLANLLALALIAGAVWWYMTNETSTMELGDDYGKDSSQDYETY